jgi:nucleotide-binding universal stress UspA family protein
VAEGRALKQAEATIDWQSRVRNLLDTYLKKFGISSEQTRQRWTDRVIADLKARSEDVPCEDISEEAIEHLRDLIDARLARIGAFDPVQEQSEIARNLVALLNKKHADTLNSFFEHIETHEDGATLEALRQTLAASLPTPMPPEAPLPMPEQTIALRSLIPSQRRTGHSS